MVGASKKPDRITNDFLIRNLAREIERYVEKGGSFSYIVSRIDEHVRQIDSLGADDAQSLHDLWVKLETINALALSEGIEPPAANDKDEVGNLLEMILVILMRIQKKPAPSS